MPAPEAENGPMQLLTQALNARPERREALWRANGDSDGSDEAELRVALLQTVPEHSGHDPAAARRRLGVLLAHKPRADLASLARLRLAELRATDDCSSELATMRARLAQLIDIEQELHRKEP